MTHLLAAGDPFQHTWNSWHLHLYFWDLDLRAIPGFEALGISNFVVAMIAAALLLLWLGRRIGRESTLAVDEGRMPRGGSHVMEVLVQFVRDDMMKPNMPHHYKDGFLISVFCTYFFFILFCNLLGLAPQPFGHTATGSPYVTGSMAFLGTLVLMFYFGIKEHGLPGFVAHLAPPAPAWIRWPLLLPIEFIGLFIKPFALTIRLAANMTAGHIILAVLMSFLTGGATVVSALVWPASAAGFLAITVFEIAIAFIQAYIFTVLSAVFVGQLVAHEH